MQAFIGKIEPVSGNHWQGGLATAIYFAGCDFNCPNCNTPEFLQTKEDFLTELKSVKNLIKQNAPYIKAVVFTGGEPCLQRQALMSLAAFAKDNGLKTGLETNGSKPDCIRPLLQLGIIDQIALDIKAPLELEAFERSTKCSTFFKSAPEIISDFKQTIRLLDMYKDKFELVVRLTIVPSLLARKEDVFAALREIEHLKCVIELQRFKPGKVLNPMFAKLHPATEDYMLMLRESIQKRYPKALVQIDPGPF
jgi:pyruvate formate lyase activating enzyme